MSIRLPADEYIGVARLVSAGVATRLDLPFSEVDDLQQAVETALRAVFQSGAEATVGIDADDVLSVAIGPASPGVLDRRLRERDADESIELRAVLERLVDSVSIRPEPDPAIVLHVDLLARRG